MTTNRKTPTQIWEEAKSAAQAAFAAAKPTPMVVGTPTTPLGNDIDFTKKTYLVPDGPCGFAYVTIRPARGALVTWLKKQDIGYNGYYGGWQFSVGKLDVPMSQSYERNTAAAQAAAEVLRNEGITAYAESRLD